MLLAGAALIVALLVLAVAPHVLRHISFFQIRQVELVGVRYLTPNVVLDALALQPDQNLFDDLEVLEERASRVRGVVQVRVRRRLPGTLRVEVSERIPMAFAPGPDGFVTVDAWGKPLPYDPTVSGLDLPVVARADTVLLGALSAIRFASRELYESVDWVEADGSGVWFEVGDRRIRMRGGPLAGDVDAIIAVIEHLAGNGDGYDELDARYDGWVVVRRSAS